MPLLREPGALAPYQQIREILRKEILENMAAGDRIAPERDLAKRFDANRATVSRAIAALVNEGLLVRRVGKGTFVAGGENGILRTITRTVGLVMPYIQGAFPAAMIRSSVRELRGHSYKAVLFDSEDSVVAEASEIERLMQEGLDGALVMPVEVQDNAPLFHRLVRLGFPLVFMDRMPLHLEADFVGTDHFWGAYEATSTLIKRGHRRIAHFTSLGPRQSTSMVLRRAGYEKALKDHGIDADPELVCPPAMFSENRYAYKHSLAYLCKGNNPVTAVLALNDLFVTSIISGCRELGIRIPEDLEVAGFIDGDFEMLMDVPLLKVVQNQNEIGKRAVELLMQRIEGNGSDDPKSITVKPQIVNRLGDLKA